MFLAIESLLDAAEVAALRETAANLAFQDGRATAGAFAQGVKDNQQAIPSADLSAIQHKVEKSLATNALFTLAARPRQMSPLLLSRYRPGQAYGSHVDDALMGTLRSDLSFTLFLSDPDSYDGGALILEDPLESRSVKLPAGDLFVYPSTTLHRVEPVRRGERLAVVGWVMSWIRDPGQREILFDLDISLRQLHGQDGKTEIVDRLSKARSNLLRMWAGA